MCPFSTEEAPFSYTFYWQMVPPFHIPSLERYIPFNCPFSPSYSEYHISLPLHGHLPQLVKSLPFHIPETWQRYCIGAEPFLVCHNREYPAGNLARPNGFWRSLPLCRYAKEWCMTTYGTIALKTIACVAIKSTVSSDMFLYCHIPGFYVDLKSSQNSP